MIINQQRLRYFYAVYTHGKIRKAAEYLNTDSSVIARQIKLLEEEIGYVLFERRHRFGMHPTEAAQIVVAFYKEALASQDKLEANLQALHDMKRGDIRLAIPAVYIDRMMENMFTDFCYEHPSLNIVIEEINNSAQIIDKILDDSSDVGVIFNTIPNPDIFCYTSRPLPIRALVSQNHPLAHKQKVNFSELAGYPVALPPPSFTFRKVIQAVEHSEKIPLTTLLTTSSTCAQKRFASAQNGIAIMSAFAAQEEISDRRLIPLEIEHPALTSVEISLIVRRGRILSPALNQLLRLLKMKLSIFTHSEKDFTPSSATYDRSN